MQTEPTARRTYGTGSIIEQNGVYFGKWRVGQRQVKRKLGPIRRPGTRDGLTKTQAEAKLRAVMAETTTAPVMERITIREAGARLLAHLETMGRKHETIRSYRSNLNSQIVPRLGRVPVGSIGRDHAEQLIEGCLRDGLAPKTTRNVLGLLSSIIEFSVKHRWATSNPCKLVDRPQAANDEKDIRFLDQPEIEALLEAVPDDDYGRVQRAIYLAATMSGMRQGELLALRWIDVDWSAQKIRVRRNYVRGRFGTPKSKRGSRSVPLADRLGGELDKLYRASAFQQDDDLVFANPHTGRPMDGQALTKAYQRALKRAGVRRVRFHDLRHTFGTRMAAVGVPMRTLQEFMGHRDLGTTAIYADYAPGAREVDLVNEAFAQASTNPGTNLSETQTNSGSRNPMNPGVMP